MAPKEKPWQKRAENWRARHSHTRHDQNWPSPTYSSACPSFIMRCEAPFEPLLLNEGNGAAENRGVVAGQVSALSTLHTDERRSLRDAQQRLILLRAARCTAHWQFEDRGGYDHKKFYCSSAPSNSSICRTLSPMTGAVAKRPQRRLVEE